MMQALQYRQNELYIDNVAILDIINKHGTPCYIYSLKTIQHQLSQLQSAFSAIPHKIFFAVKANNNLAILNHFVKEKIGFDVVSGGELKRALAAGANAESVIFSGVGKSRDELTDAILNNIHCINIESEQELKLLITLATHHKKRVNVAVRINPNIDAHTHAAISTGLLENKFGVLEEELDDLIPLLQSPYLHCIGIACHIGSQITSVEPFQKAAQKMADIATKLRTHHLPLSHIDLGGGLGITYDETPAPDITAYAQAIIPILRPLNLELYLEPGRLLIGPAACLITEVLYTKIHRHHAFAIVDAGMNDFMRPALYAADHQLHPVHLSTDNKIPYDVVGPVCESTDCFARAYPIALKAGDYLAFDSVGAYGSSMSSHYNARPLIPEVLVVNNKHFLIRKREMIEETFKNDIIPT